MKTAGGEAGGRDAEGAESRRRIGAERGYGLEGGCAPSPENLLGILCGRMHFGALFTEEYQ